MKGIRKKLTAAFALLLLAALFCISAAARDAGEGFADMYPRLIDTASLLDDSEKEKLLHDLDEISKRQKLDVAIATINSLDGKDIVSFADDLYDHCQFGYGADRDGILLLISMEERSWYISTCGYGITAFTDAGIQYIGQQIKEDLSKGNYAAAFQKFTQHCDTFISQARKGRPFDKSHLPKKPMSPFWILLFLFLGIIIARGVVNQMKAKLKTVRSQPEAKNYIKDNSLTITRSRDLFLYRTVSKTKKEKNRDSGSSTHTSSSGTTHGGGGGKF